MQKIRVPINSFQYGEVSRSAMMRTDNQIYNASAQSLKNMVVMSEGSIKKRPSLKNHYRFPDITQDTSKVSQSFIVPFIFSGDERYLISLEHQKVRCFRIENGSLSLVETITADTNAAALPFDDDYLHQYTVAQYGDVMFICHPLFMPRMLIRTSLTDFEITPYTFDVRADNKQVYQPYSVFHRQGVTLDPSASSGTNVTFTVSQPYFDTTGTKTAGNYLSSKHVGVVLRIDKNEIEITSVQSATQAKGNIIGDLTSRLEILNPLRTTDGSAVIEVTHLSHGFGGGESIVISGAGAVGGINANQINGTRTIGTIVDINTYTITAGASANESIDGGGLVKVLTHAPTDQWDEQSFSAARGYPAAITFHENRLVFGGTIQEPDTIWFSRIGEFFDFNFGTALDDEAFNLVAATGDVNEIRYLVSSRDLQIFTDASELYVPAFLNQSITPTNAQIRKQTPYGSVFVTPSSIDGATIFVQTGGSVVREYLYTDTEDSYTATSISTVASHLINSPIDMDVVHGAFNEAESYAALVSSDGYLSIFGSNRAEKRAAWMKWVSASGSFGTIAAVDDRLFATVWCGGYLKLCEFTGDYGLDSYVYGAGPTISMSNVFDNGSVVHIVGEASTGRLDYLGTQAVASNEIDVSAFDGYTSFYVGVPFEIEIKTNSIDASMGNGPVTGDVRGISSVIVDMKDTRSMLVNGRPLVTTLNVTGKKEFRLNGYGRDPQVTITQSHPLPIQVNGLIAELSV